MSEQEQEQEQQQPDGAEFQVSDDGETRVPFDEAKEEAWAIHEANTDGALGLGGAAQRLIDIGQEKKWHNEIGKEVPWYLKEEEAALRESLDGRVKKAFRPFDQLKEANPDRYHSLDADGIRAWAEQLAREDWIIDEWSAGAEHYKGQVDRVQSAIDDGHDIVAEFLAKKWNKDRYRELTEGIVDNEDVINNNWFDWSKGFVDLFGMNREINGPGTIPEEEENQRNWRERHGVVWPMIEAMKRIKEEQFTLSPKDKLVIYMQAMKNIGQMADGWVEDATAKRNVVLDKFRNGDEVVSEQ